MKIATYEKTKGIYNISAEIHLVFSRKNSLNGFFILKNLSADAQKAFSTNLTGSHKEKEQAEKITDYALFLQKIEEDIISFFEKVELKEAKYKKLIYIKYINSIINDEQSTAINLAFAIFDTYWNKNVLLKAVDSNGIDAMIEFNSPANYNCAYIEYSTEKEQFLKDVVFHINQANVKLSNLFEKDFLNKNSISLDDKIKDVMNNNRCFLLDK